MSSECWELEGEPASLARALEEEVMGLYTLWEKTFHSTSSQVSRQWFQTPIQVYCSSVLRIRDVYPGSRILIFTHPGSLISDPGSRILKQQQKRIFVKPFYVATNFTKLKIILVLKCGIKKFGPIFKEL